MTISSERTSSLIITEQFLKDLLDPKKTPRVPKAVRQQASRCLRHHPGMFDLIYLANVELQSGSRSGEPILDLPTLEVENDRRNREWAGQHSPKMLADVIASQERAGD